MRRASFEVSTCIVRCESVRRSTHVLTSFGVSRKTNRQYTSFPAGMSVYCLLCVDVMIYRVLSFPCFSIIRR